MFKNLAIISGVASIVVVALTAVAVYHYKRNENFRGLIDGVLNQFTEDNGTIPCTSCANDTCDSCLNVREFNGAAEE